MEDIYIGTPNAKQDEFLRCKKKYVAFGGARGGGKSWAVRCKAGCWRSGIRGYGCCWCGGPCRRSRQTIWRRCGWSWRVRPYTGRRRRFVFGERERIAVRILRLRPGRGSLSGRGVRRDLFDEATQLKEQWMRKLAACVRGVNGFPKRIYYTCNLGGPGHGYIKRLFIDRRYEPGENGGEYVHTGAGDGQPGRCWRGSREYTTAAGGAAAEAAGGVGWRGGGRAGGTGVPGVHGRPGALRGPAVDARDPAL